MGTKGDSMGGELLNIIRTANREFQEFIDKASQDGAKVVESRGAGRRLDKLDVRLKQVGEQLDAVAELEAPDPEAAYQLMRYRENLRANMQAACAWATSVRDIY